ncbi:MAG TPA: hypothetical protein VH350_04925 [Candidatus Sulfotelmatobacter sp.]|jgi:hypothetical protein|nr:hypothetical protein [Candidatus Sulfotelmatobacter sp.]
MKRLIFCALIVFIGLPAFSQQSDINRYTWFTGFDYMISPARNLAERGFETDFGVTVKPWLGLGADFGALGSDIISGAGTINGSETVYAPVLTQYGSIGAPAPNTVHVAFKSTTYTFAAGPQFYLRKWEKVTLFARPGFGGIHENANFAFPPALVPLFELLQVPIPNAHQNDTELFFGLGGGVDLNVSRIVGARFAADWVNTHLFSNLLTPRQNYIRFSLGPTFRWGHLSQSR